MPTQGRRLDAHPSHLRLDEQRIEARVVSNEATAAEALREVACYLFKMRRLANVHSTHPVDPLGTSVPLGIHKRGPRFAPPFRLERYNGHLDYPMVVARVESGGLHVNHRHRARDTGRAGINVRGSTTPMHTLSPKSCQGLRSVTRTVTSRHDGPRPGPRSPPRRSPP